MDGLFDVPENQTSKHNFPVETNSEWPQRFEHSHSEQFYLHESTLNSLFRLMDDSFFPYQLKNGNVSDALITAIPQLKTKYGDDVTVSLNITMEPNNTDTPIHLDTESGIVFGSKDSIKTLISIICTNATVSEEVSLLGTNVMA